jgi:tetratricopeptide (TPR) repeat protein
MLTHEVSWRNQRILSSRGALDATQSRVLTSKPSKPKQAPAQLSWPQAKLPMLFPPSSRLFPFAIIAFILVAVCSSVAQTIDFTDGETDPVKLFERAQNAHAKGEVERALALYEAAIKLRPEFPEAEYQRGVALVTLRRPGEAETPFRRAIELRKDWSLPYSALGNLLARSEKDKEAEPLLRRALQLGATDFTTLDSLSTLRLRAGDKQEALSLAKRATEDESAPASAWTWRAATERASGDVAAALTSLEHALKIEPNYVGALTERAELRIEKADYEKAIEDLKAALIIKPSDKDISLRLAKVYQLANKPDEMRRVYESIGYEVYDPGVSPTPQSKGVVNVVGSAEDIAAANDDDPKVAQPALERLIASNLKNAGLFARLGEVTRRSDPQKSAESYRRANEIDPRNPKYATGYAAALVQARRFAEAVAILRQVIASAPNEYAAHANLALALYELKDFPKALPEYEWLAAARPEIAATYFFIAIAHDNLSEYEQALEAYEKFLSLADPAINKLEIEKVNLRLPKLRDQIRRGQGVKKKKS